MIYTDYQDYYYHPINNFKDANLKGNGPEQKFGTNFICWFNLISEKDLIAIRELPIPGLGIPDFIVIEKKHPKKIDLAQIHSFEFKIKDWRKGLMQAHRYKYFSNTSILVIPSQAAQRAEKSILLFIKLGIGLWVFNAASCSVIKKFTPRPKKIVDTKRAAYVLDKALQYHIHN